MKIALNRFGLFDYTISGPNEEAASTELESRLDQLGSSPFRVDSEDISDIRRSIAIKYGVEIGTTIDTDYYQSCYRLDGKEES